MKKNIFLLAIPFLLLACSQIDTSKEIYEKQFRLSNQYYNEFLKGLVMDDNFSMCQEALDNNDSFGVFIYQNGCSACAQMMPRVISVLSKHNVYFYSIPLAAARDKNCTKITNVVKYTPSVVLFDYGEVVTYLDAKKNEHTPAYSTEDGFEKWITYYIDM